MTKKPKFSEVARTEKFFVATLLSHFLMANDFEGLQILFKFLFKNTNIEFQKLKQDFEIVSELDPLRDGALQSENIKNLYKQFGRVAVPDLFLRWDNLCLVLEAKFFTDPEEEDLEEQLIQQKDAIDKVKGFSFYNNMEIHFGTVTIEKVKFKNLTAAHSIIWDEIVDMMGKITKSELGIQYCKQAIKSAITRAREELSPSKKSISFEMLKFDEIIASLPKLIKDGKIFIGVMGGEESLSKIDLPTLIQKPHYKVSDIKHSENWISIDKFLHRLFELKNLF